MVLEFHELEYHQKIFSKFEDYLKKKKKKKTRVFGTRVSWQAQFSQTRVSKK